ncbi:hypothetical protein EIK77_000073, partial [Talaromyces pinophilus]
MGEQRKRLSHDAYSVALICPLEVEMSAVRYMLDDEHDRLPPAAGDTNQYILGELSGHNVAIACLPVGYQGKAWAAAISRDMERTYPSIRLRLLVGIGGGVPREGVDIRLGDVVIGTPSGLHGGVVQYDLGKQTSAGFLRKGFLCSPPAGWLSVLAIMQSTHRAQPNMIPDFIEDMVSKFPRLVAYKRPSEAEDNLFRSEYVHDYRKITCVDCSKAMIVPRARRGSTNDPVVHYGTIASGDQVIKDAQVRDKLSRESDGAICFEMEAAGLMNDFRCIVIRGISDYADSHKNDVWQPYAAAAAAAMAKELLCYFDSASAMQSLPVPSAPISLASAANETFSTPRSADSTGSKKGHIMDNPSEKSASESNIITTYGGFDAWLSSFKPSSTATPPKKPGTYQRIEATRPNGQQNPRIHSSLARPDYLGYVTLKITGLRRIMGSTTLSDQEVILPHISWRTSLVQLSLMIQER